MITRTQLLLTVSLGVGLVWLPSGQRQVQAQVPVVQSQGAITEVSVEREAWFNGYYKLTLKNDGNATFVRYSHGLEAPVRGKLPAHVDRVGTYEVGTYTARFYGFDRLARAINQRDYWHLKDKYRVPVSDAPHTTTTVVGLGQSKTINEFGASGPQELWEIETLIEGTVAEAHWHKISSSTDVKP